MTASKRLRGGVRGQMCNELWGQVQSQSGMRDGFRFRDKGVIRVRLCCQDVRIWAKVLSRQGCYAGRAIGWAGLLNGYGC